MLRHLRNRASEEKGFTLIELLVVILIIGILAAIALPVFLGQQEKGKDASAKSDVRNAYSHVESCYADSPSQSYSDCTYDKVGTVGQTGFAFVNGAPTKDANPTEVRVEILGGGTGFRVTSISSTSTTFSIEKNGGRPTRSCSGSTAGCRGSSW